MPLTDSLHTPDKFPGGPGRNQRALVATQGGWFDVDDDGTVTPLGPSRVYDVRLMGAIGDGSHDDTTILQSTIDTVIAAGGGVIYFPPGTYKLTTALTIAPAATDTDVALVIHGASKHSTILQQTGAGENVLDIYDAAGDNGWPYNVGVTVRDLGIRGDATTGIGVRVENIHDVLLDNLDVRSVGEQGIYTVTAYVCRVMNCTARLCGGKGIEISTLGHWTLLDHCSTKGNGDWGIVCQTSNGVSVLSCDSENNTNGDIRILGCGGALVAGNYIETKAGAVGIELENDARGVTVSGNYLLGLDAGGLYGINVATAHGVEVLGNYAKNYDNFIWTKSAARDVHIGQNDNNCTVYVKLDNNYTRVDRLIDSGETYDVVPLGTTYVRRHYLADSTTTGLADLQGDLIFNTSPDAGQVAGYACVAGGSPGTWNAMPLQATGTWTPAFTGSSTAGTFTYTAERSGYYIRIGNLVLAYGDVGISAITGAPSGNMQITGLPFTAANKEHASVVLGMVSELDVDTTDTIQLSAFLRKNTTQIELYEIIDNDVARAFPAARFTNVDCRIVFSVMYEAA